MKELPKANLQQLRKVLHRNIPNGLPTPEANLIFSVIMQAISDLKKHGEKASKATNGDQLDAYLFMIDGRLDLLCEVIDLNPVMVRELTEKHYLLGSIKDWLLLRQPIREVYDERTEEYVQ